MQYALLNCDTRRGVTFLDLPAPGMADIDLFEQEGDKFVRLAEAYVKGNNVRLFRRLEGGRHYKGTDQVVGRSNT